MVREPFKSIFNSSWVVKILKFVGFLLKIGIFQNFDAARRHWRYRGGSDGAAVNGAAGVLVAA